MTIEYYVGRSELGATFFSREQRKDSLTMIVASGDYSIS